MAVSLVSEEAEEQEARGNSVPEDRGLKVETDLKIRVASEADLDSLVRLAVAFRDHLGQTAPSDTDFHESIAILLKNAGTEFFLACSTPGTDLGYMQCRYHTPHSAER